MLYNTKDADIEAKTKQRSKGKENTSELDNSDSSIHRSEHYMKHIPHEATSSDQKTHW